MNGNIDPRFTIRASAALVMRALPCSGEHFSICCTSPMCEHKMRNKAVLEIICEAAAIVQDPKGTQTRGKHLRRFLR